MARPGTPVLLWLIDAAAAVAFAAALSAAVVLWQAGDAHLPVILVGLVAATLLRGAARWAATSSGQQVAARMKADWRARVHGRMLTTAPGTRIMLGEQVADAIDRIEGLDGYYARFRPQRAAATMAPLLIAAAVATASPVSALILLVTLLPFGLGMALAGSAASRAATRQLEALGRLSGLFVDRLRLLPVIVAFGAEARVSRQVMHATRDVAQRTLTVLRIAFVSSAVIDFFAALSVALVAVYCGFSLLGLLPFPSPEALALEDALFVLVLAPEFYVPMRRLAASYHDKQTGEAALDRLQAEASTPAAPAHPPLVRSPSLRFEDVVVAYGDSRVGPFSFDVPAGRMTAISGPTGIGKSSLLHALLGLVPVASGRILVDGRPLPPGGLAGAVGWAGQGVALLPGTLADNIRLARPDADDASVDSVARRVGLDVLLDGRLSAERGALDPRGSGLSGGERRRIAVARVLLRDAPLWLLDEPTADLDAASATAIAETLRIAGGGNTVLLVTHTVALAASADHRVVLA